MNSWAAPIVVREITRDALEAYAEMAKLGRDRRSEHETLTIETYRESHNIDQAIAEAKKALDGTRKTRT